MIVDLSSLTVLLPCVCIYIFLSGLGCRVHNAVMRTDEEGRASDVFWVTDLRGRKVRVLGFFWRRVLGFWGILWMCINAHVVWTAESP